MKHRNYKNGFLYGDALIASSILLLLLPVILQVLSMSTTMVERAYEQDAITQEVVAFIEEGKADYDSGQMPQEGINTSRKGGTHLHVMFHRIGTVEMIHSIPIYRYTVQAKKDGKVIYELSTFLGPPMESVHSEL
ncbi:hypothetical protein [Veillonella agrestimuris]|uniref:hypothetical protein n=1 Tax=Veillonella agrestimuris TaxID=2941340 RepID=UPI00204097A9|nr:hypothetical protein [Veillonella agrestimuris]